MCENESMRKSECMCVWEWKRVREWEKELDRESLRERRGDRNSERKSGVCECVCEREIDDRKRESVCMC